MKFFKKPVVAIILAILIVFSSTVFSILDDVRDDIDELSRCFYHGESHDGAENGIHAYLLEFCNLGEAAAIYAAGKGLDDAELISAKSELENELRRVELNIDDIYDSYVSLCAALENFRVKLSSTPLSSDEAREAADIIYSAEIIKNNINNSSYNSLRTRFAEELSPLENLFAMLFDLDIPGYFI